MYLLRDLMYPSAVRPSSFWHYLIQLSSAHAQGQKQTLKIAFTAVQYVSGNELVSLDQAR